MPQAQTIIRNDPTFPEWLNFEFLRKEGLSHVGKLSGKLWTDHNTHDPGITILEVLCYALTDLGYRNLFDIQDIFAQDFAERQAGTPDSNFFSPAEILSSNPLTVDDFRKMLLDIPGIRNAWLEKADVKESPINKSFEKEGKLEPRFFANTATRSLTFTNQNDEHKEVIIKGLYNVLIDLEDFTPQYNANPNKEITQELVLNEVKKRLQAHRNLCEDFMNIDVMEPQNIHFCMELDLTANAIPEDVFVEIFEEIQKFLTPTIRFYTLQELLAKGKSVEDIFEGRPYSIDSHGFIDTDELKTLEPKDKLHVSDIHRILLNLPSKGVRAVRALTASNDLSQENSWCLPLDKNRSPLINIDESTILYSKGALPIQFDKTIVKKKLNQRLANYYKNKRSLYELGFQIPQGIQIGRASCRERV